MTTGKTIAFASNSNEKISIEKLEAENQRLRNDMQALKLLLSQYRNETQINQKQIIESVALNDVGPTQSFRRLSQSGKTSTDNAVAVSSINTRPKTGNGLVSSLPNIKHNPAPNNDAAAQRKLIIPIKTMSIKRENDHSSSSSADEHPIEEESEGQRCLHGNVKLLKNRQKQHDDMKEKHRHSSRVVKLSDDSNDFFMESGLIGNDDNNYTLTNTKIVEAFLHEKSPASSLSHRNIVGGGNVTPDIEMDHLLHPPSSGNNSILLQQLSMHPLLNAARTRQSNVTTLHKESFWQSVQDRASWLIGLLVLQSMSSFIIARNETLLQEHIVIIRFLTMLVGAGGNAGNQASVNVIRGLAVGTVTEKNAKKYLFHEVKMAGALSCLIGTAGMIRVVVFMTPLREAIAITASLFTIVLISILLGATLPMLMKVCHIDPAHSSTTIQVFMDILGVLITVNVSAFVLNASVKN